MSRVCVAHEESPHPLRHVVDIGDEQPLWAGASSKILLRDASDTCCAGSPRPPPSRRGARRPAARPGRESAQRGYAVSSSEFDGGPTAVAVPVTSRSGKVIASLSLSGPTHRFPYKAVERFATDLAEAATLISAKGFSHPLNQDR
ncbi:IclR family transcriptional regulator domain-containing protein [Streptomyces sp. SD31]|uniref:IclR family transcriptional regulator domain-containing protein n=1 Tax=Streptomyces sp. SD31 TaxID=3452208 RepID=UPI003F8B8565